LSLEEWRAWQVSVVSAIRAEFRELFSNVHHDEFDWDAWRPLYEEGWLPADAVRQALSPRPESPAISPMAVD
jgi:hypothetical protein